MRSQVAAVIVALAALAGCAAVAASATAYDSGGASAADSSQIVLRRGDRGPAVRRVQRRLRITVSGRYASRTVGAVEHFQRSRDLSVDGKVGPATRRAMGLAPFSSSEVFRPRHRVPRILRYIARCESHDNPRAISSSGTYRGKYQFSFRTWHSIGGDGDPARAPERVQDRLATRLYHRRGTQPWPRCGPVARSAMQRS